MTQFIDKDAVITKIDNLKHRIDDRYSYSNGWKDALRMMEAELDTLEVKDVDSLTPEEIKKICTIYDNLNQERKCATVLYNSDETFFNHVLMEYKSII